jgi:acyl-[acyl-carrier-protein]-phospholipid O-acyltransferase/long-chain-fatty-acid--[acyl-carrier-protein] ligase
MLIALAIAGVLAAAWVLAALVLTLTRRLSFHQAFFLAPMKLFYRLTGTSAPARAADPPVIYAVLHQSRLDPALMLSMLPDDTLHMLDEASARSAWLEPWREMARTIAFNPRHVFVSRRLVRHLRGRGRLAVYFPDGIEQDSRAYRLYRAVAKIAAAAEARIVAVSVQGSRTSALAFTPRTRRRLLPRLTVSMLEPLSMAELVARSRRESPTMAGALFDRVAEADAA